MIWAVIWYAVLAALTAADTITTKIALMNGYQEINPFLAPFTDHLFEIKVAFMLITIVLTVWAERSVKGSGWVVPATGACITLTPVISNIAVLSGARLLF